MGIYILIPALFLIGLASYGISNVIYKRLVRAGNNYAKAIRIGSFIVSFIIIFVGVVVLILYNIKLER